MRLYGTIFVEDDDLKIESNLERATSYTFGLILSDTMRVALTSAQAQILADGLARAGVRASALGNGTVVTVDEHHADEHAAGLL
jgi:hypothetical protein